MNSREQVAMHTQLSNAAIEAKSPMINAVSSNLREHTQISDHELAIKLDSYSLEDIVEVKISRFLEQLGTFYPEDLHTMIMQKVEKPLLKQILLRTGGNQVHAARILGINRNTLRKKMKMYSL